MQSAWIDRDAEAAVARYQSLGRDVALRVYTTRLLGQDPRLVLHGGGNTSVKTKIADLNGDDVEVLCVKGSGWDMGTIEPAGLPAVRLEPLLKLRARETLSDEEMVRLQRANLIDPASPNPSVEALLHAFIPHKFIDHTHSTAVLALTDQPDGEALCREVFGARVGYVPYLMPGFGLAKAAARVFEADPSVEGLILVKHGIFSFGADARQAYERMIALVSLAEARLAKNRKPAFVSAKLPARLAGVADVAPIIRGACSFPDSKTDGAWKRFVLEFRGNDAVMNFVNGAEVARYGQAGVVTPDHNIRIKNKPMVVAAPAEGDLAGFRNSVRDAVAAYGEAYKDLFRPQQCARRRDQDHARHRAARGAGARCRPVRARPQQEGREGRRRSGGSRHCHHHGRRSRRPLRAVAGGRSVRCRILVARAGQARRRQRVAAGRTGRRHHRRRRRHWFCNRKSVRGGGRRSGAARSRRGRRAGKGQSDRRRGAGNSLRRH